MPELPEVEIFRQLADKASHRKIKTVFAPDSWYVKGGYQPLDIQNALTGKQANTIRRHGKLLLFDFDDVVLGIHFGMSGRLQVDDQMGLDQLMYSSNRNEPEWRRFGLLFEDGGALYVHDPRRLGGVELDPNESVLGPDALSVTYEELKAGLNPSSSPVKSRIMDQHVIAGIGNLIADEVLWRAGIDPSHAARALSNKQIKHLQETIHDTIPELVSRGGCHLGDLIEHRVEGGRCPRDGAILLKQTLGGRTTWYCPKHQR